jgi:hypothetical protein
MHAEQLAAENGIEIQYLRKKNLRQEELVQAILAKRGSHPGLVAMFSAMEASSTYQPGHNQQTGKTYLKPDDGQFLHYYFYFLDEELGLTYVRVPTWLPCRLQIYFNFNGHNGFAAQLGKRKIAYQLLDNALVEIGDWNQAQRIADDWKVQPMQRKFDGVCAAVLSHGSSLRRAIPLEPGSKRLRHRPRFPPTSRSSAPVCQLDSHRYPRRQARQHRHFFGKEIERQLPR